MPDDVVIVDYQLGNLYNVLRMCRYVGLPARIGSTPDDVASASAIILPGVGAFGDAMAFLRDSGLAPALCSFASSGRPLLGVCLGMQLLMSESYEFGRHQGLGIVPGSVVPFAGPTVKVPQVGWNRIHRPKNRDAWCGTLLEGLEDGEYMYFVHSYHVVPKDSSVVLATARYGNTEFCSCLHLADIVGCQFHPERSGVQGASIYRRFAEELKRRNQAGAPHSPGAGAGFGAAR